MGKEGKATTKASKKRGRNPESRRIGNCLIMSRVSYEIVKNNMPLELHPEPRGCYMSVKIKDSGL